MVGTIAVNDVVAHDVNQWRLLVDTRRRELLLASLGPRRQCPVGGESGLIDFVDWYRKSFGEETP